MNIWKNNECEKYVCHCMYYIYMKLCNLCVLNEVWIYRMVHNLCVEFYAYDEEVFLSYKIYLMCLTGSYRTAAYVEPLRKTNRWGVHNLLPVKVCNLHHNSTLQITHFHGTLRTPRLFVLLGGSTYAAVL